MLNPIDTALQSVSPTLMVPKFQELESLQSNGHRFLVAADGMWLEARRPWLYMRWPLVQQTKVAMPYGVVEKALQVRPAAQSLLLDFVQFAKQQCPLECAAWIVWNERTDEWKLVKLAPKVARNDYVAFDRPALEEGEHLIVDIHSHGRIGAFFSSTDDKDDRGEFKVAAVFGCLDGDVQAKFRLCANVRNPAKLDA
ncbi:PRTRC system protein A [Undibacterium arcticum]|uniref:PRTRC system protein A n=1 Tax=Undibacterium arcticum TaxID=1762892 RepID=A0ABV7FAL9_9BURK